jgi:protein tyrosine/serine phosphatase
VAGIVAIGCEQLWRHGHDYLFPEKFATVVPGRIYRGAWQQEWPMRRIVDQHKIKTIVALAHPPSNVLVKREQSLARELGCDWVHVPIVDDRTIADEEALFTRLEEAAAIVADPARQPVFFHCHHGINRASMVQMAYRMLYCGWSLNEATEEIAKTFGLHDVDNGPDYRHMARFFEERAMPGRSGEIRAGREAGAAAMGVDGDGEYPVRR